MNTNRIVPISRHTHDESLRDLLKKLNIGMTPPEARKIVSILGRDPHIVELFIFDIEWSEHCSYKSSRSTLKKYPPTDAPNVILGPGEDSGIIRFTDALDGETYSIVIAHESHNHPSQVLPVEGAATGIGGIVRDVDCMGAHVCAVADGLRFGNPAGAQPARTRWIIRGVVDGIWQYGNAMGVPNLAGDVYFDDSFDDNCLVNVVSLGIVKTSRIIRSRVPTEARNEPYDLILAGKPTDSSGFGGVTFASDILDASQDDKRRGAVQVHDPFIKNILIMRKANRAVLDLAFERDIPIGMKDLGGGGLACASSEICSASGFGAEIDLDCVHTSMDDLPPEVIACGETQERFIFAVPRSFTREVLDIYNTVWELPAEANGAGARCIGRVLEEPIYRIRHHGEVVCEAPIEQITSGIRYERADCECRHEGMEPEGLPPDNLADALLSILGSLNGCSRLPIYRHYDTEVQGAAVLRPGEADAGVIAPLELTENCPAGIALSVDGNPNVGAIDPYWGGATAVAEAMRNVVATGAIPRALTDCLNYGNPENPSAFRQFVDGVRGIADAARQLSQLDLPDAPVAVVSGNVSFYNESAQGLAIKPSPIVACVGTMPDFARAMTIHFKNPGNRIILVGERRPELGGSAYYRIVRGVDGTKPLTVKWREERAAMAAVHTLISHGYACACHDISDGGFATALAEMCLSHRRTRLLGAHVVFTQPPIPADQFLFAETGGFILEIPPDHLKECTAILNASGGVWYDCGCVTETPELLIEIAQTARIHLPVQDMRLAWLRGLEEIV